MTEIILTKYTETTNVTVNEHLFIIMDNRISIPVRPNGREISGRRLS